MRNPSRRSDSLINLTVLLSKLPPVEEEVWEGYIPFSGLSPDGSTGKVLASAIASISFPKAYEGSVELVGAVHNIPYSVDWNSDLIVLVGAKVRIRVPAGVGLVNVPLTFCLEPLHTSAASAASITFPSSPPEDATWDTKDLQLGLFPSQWIQLVSYSGGELPSADPQPLYIAGGVFGVPEPGIVVSRFVSPTAFRLPQNLPGSKGYAAVAATGGANMEINKNDAFVGSLVFSSGDPVGTFYLTDAVDYAAGDVLTVLSSFPADATLADIAFTLVAEVL